MTERSFRIERNDRQCRFIGELDLSAYDSAMAELEPLLSTGGDLVLDLEELTFLDSSGIRVLVNCRSALDGRGRLIVRSANAHVTKILEIAGLPDLGVELDGPRDG